MSTTPTPAKCQRPETEFKTTTKEEAKNLKESFNEQFNIRYELIDKCTR